MTIWKNVLHNQFAIKYWVLGFKFENVTTLIHVLPINVTYYIQMEAYLFTKLQ